MLIKPTLSKCSGTILIVTLWILVILTVFAIALGQRASLEVKLTEYQRDKLRATELAKAAIERAIWEKRSDLNKDVDSLAESWANNEAVFKDFAFGDENFTGTFTVSYFLDGITLYGMEDEESKINLNNVDEPVLVKLLEGCAVEDAGEIASSILIWSGKKPDVQNEEEGYYQGLDLPYHCKKEKFKSTAELLLVRHIREKPEILFGKDIDGDRKISEDEQGIAQYLTVYSGDAVNINTASEKVLTALITGSSAQPVGFDVEALVEAIVAYRQGDGDLQTRDDNNWFFLSSGQLQLSNSQAFAYIQDTPEWQKLQSLVATNKLSVNSNIYTIHTQAEVSKVKSSLTATVDLSDPTQISYLFWHQN